MIFEIVLLHKSSRGLFATFKGEAGINQAFIFWEIKRPSTKTSSLFQFNKYWSFAKTKNPFIVFQFIFDWAEERQLKNHQDWHVIIFRDGDIIFQSSKKYKAIPVVLGNCRYMLDNWFNKWIENKKTNIFFYFFTSWML